MRTQKRNLKRITTQIFIEVAECENQDVYMDKDIVVMLVVPRTLVKPSILCLCKLSYYLALRREKSFGFEERKQKGEKEKVSCSVLLIDSQYDFCLLFFSSPYIFSLFMELI